MSQQLTIQLTGAWETPDVLYGQVFTTNICDEINILMFAYLTDVS